MMICTCVLTTFVRRPDGMYRRYVFKASAGNAVLALAKLQDAIPDDLREESFRANCGDLSQLGITEVWWHHPGQEREVSVPHTFRASENADGSWDFFIAGMPERIGVTVATSNGGEIMEGR